MTEELLAFVKRQESLQLKPYLDQLGLPTIGYGHRIGSLDHPPITEAEADHMLAEDLGVAEALALGLCANLAKYPRKLAALTDLVFNGGARTLQGKDIHDPDDDAGLVKALRREDWEDAATRFKMYCHGHKPDGTVVVLPVLERRRAIAATWIVAA